MKSQHQSDNKIKEFFENSAKVTEVLQMGISKALVQHKQAGNPVCVWKDGKVIWIAPDNIPDKRKKNPQ